MSPAPCIDRLVWIADNRDIFVPCGQLVDPRILRLVSILVFVDKNRTELILVAFQDRRILLKKQNGSHNKVAEIESLQHSLLFLV